MSKLFAKYSNLKEKNPNVIYLFKSGIFYLALQEDAKLLAEEFGFRVTNLNEDVVKSGFPASRIDYYTTLFQSKHIVFEIVDDTYGVIDNYADYLNNEKTKEIIQELIHLDFNTISFKDAFTLLQKYSENLKEIYSKKEMEKQDGK